MIDLAAARAIALAHINAPPPFPYPGAPTDFVILDGRTIERPYGWVFFWDSRRHQETGDLRDALAGNGPVLVTREGKVHPFSTAYPVHEHLAAYEQGFTGGRCDLVVTRVRDVRRAADALHGAGIDEVVPEVAHGVEWRIPRRLTHRELKARMATLPCTFAGQTLGVHAARVLLKARDEGVLSFELRESSELDSVRARIPGRDASNDPVAAHAYSSRHRALVLASAECGCFYCLAGFRPDEIVEWVDENAEGEGQTALCPRCGIDSVLRSASPIAVTGDLLCRMKAHWFE